MFRNVQKCQTEAESFPTSCLSPSLKFQPLLLDACKLDNVQLFLQHHLDHEALVQVQLIVSKRSCRNQRRQIIYLSGKGHQGGANDANCEKMGFEGGNLLQSAVDCGWCRIIKDLGSRPIMNSVGGWWSRKKF